MNDQQVPTIKNQLIRSLPVDVRERLKPHLEYIESPVAMPLYESNERIKNVYFPVNAMASIVATTSSGHSTEIAVVGGEGVVGVEVFMGANTSPHKSMIQIAGHSYRMNVDAAIEEFKKYGAFHDAALRFAQKLYIQVAQTTLCNRLHNVDERLPRWLLMCHDRVESDQIMLTQEFIALMLGTSRVTVTQAAQAIQNVGYINYVRGKINIVDRQGLEDISCDCYHVVKREYDRK